MKDIGKTMNLMDRVESTIHSQSILKMNSTIRIFQNLEINGYIIKANSKMTQNTEKVI